MREVCRRMSAIGTKRTWAIALHMSAFGGKADIGASGKKNAREVRNKFCNRDVTY